MAGTAVTFVALNEMKASFRGLPTNIADQFGTALTAAVTDLDVIRTQLALAEDFILEVNTDFEAVSRGSATDTVIASVVDGAGQTLAAITTTGAAVGDVTMGSINLDLVDNIFAQYVSAANAMQIRQQNESTATLDLSDTNIITVVSIPNGAQAWTGTITAAVMTATALDTAGDLTAMNITIS